MANNKSKANRRIGIWQKTGGLCAHCGRKASSREQTIDHYLPKSFGGGYDNRNLVPLCKTCNKARDNKPINPAVFYKFAPQWVVQQCLEYEKEFNLKYSSMGDKEQ